MAYAGGHAQHYKRIEPLRYIKRGLGIVPALRRVRRLKHGYFGMGSIQAVILLVLAAVAARIIRRNEHESAVYAAVSEREYGVRRNVHANVLHGRERPCSAYGRAAGDLHGGLFVAGPLAVYFILIFFANVFKYLRAGRSRVRRGNMAAGLVHAPCYGLVAA